jgi:hypothetical protein
MCISHYLFMCLYIRIHTHQGVVGGIRAKLAGMQEKIGEEAGKREHFSQVEKLLTIRLIFNQLYGMTIVLTFESCLLYMMLYMSNVSLLCEMTMVLTFESCLTGI